MGRMFRLRLGEPDAQGQPGYIRINTLHQGNFNGHKGIYHINAVDEVRQWEIVASVGRISEAYLVPVLESMLVQFPFVIRGFHSDNGSVYKICQPGCLKPFPSGSSFN